MNPTKRQPRSNLGVWVFERQDRPNTPYCVQRKVNGKRETIGFATAAERDRPAESVSSRRRGCGSADWTDGQ